jgi:hypothetical protein
MNQSSRHLFQLSTFTLQFLSIAPPLPLEKIPVNPHRLNTALSVAPLKNTLASSVQSGGARVTLYVSPQIRIVSEQRLDFFPSLASLRISNGHLKNTP